MYTVRHCQPKSPYRDKLRPYWINRSRLLQQPPRHLHSGVHLNAALEHYNFFCMLSHK